MTFFQKILSLTTGGTLILLATLANANDFAKKYPEPRRGDQTDDYFGTSVPDPYRWMEEEKNADLQRWIEEENVVTQSELAKIPYREQLKREITDRYNYAKYSLPFKKNGRYFYFKNDGLQNQSVLYTKARLEDDEKVLLDPNRFSDDGTVSLSALGISQDGKFLAYAVSKSGSDWKEAFVLDVETGEKLTDHLKWIKFSDLSWQKDGFYYSRYDEPEKGKEFSEKNEFHKVYYHRVGTDQSDDLLVFENKDEPLRNCVAEVDEDENWLFFSETESTYGNMLLFKDLRVENAPVRTAFPNFEAETSVVTIRPNADGDERFYCLTDFNAPNRRLVAVDPNDPLPDRWIDVIPEGDSLLESVVDLNGRLLVRYLKDAASECDFFDLQGKKTGELKLPTLGVCSVSGQKNDPEFFYGFTSFVYPTVVYRYDLNDDSSNVLFEPKIDFVPENYQTDRVWYTSKDGTKAPMFLTYKKGLRRNGDAPTLLYGYGGFNISMTPSFSPSRTVFLDHGGLLAVAILRGGGEYGENWHKAGTKLQKQNVFDDFISAAEFLIRENYTKSAKLAINGGSNGGLLVGAALTQRPDLFQVAVPAVGVLDMLRYHKFTIGWAWATDYGTSEESPEMFDYLFQYSPLHNVKPGTKYPATLIMTSDHDDRVVPAHSFKFAATLQQANVGENPILIRIETKAGHGSGKPLAKIIEEAADMYSFIFYHLGFEQL